MTPHEFKYALEMGFGRAIQFLRSHDPAPYQEIILQACLNYTGLNLQTDGGRHEYLFEAMQLSANPSAIEHKMLEALTQLGDDGESNQQVVDLAIVIAKNGSSQAKQAILDLHLADPEEIGRYGMPCSEAIIELDSLPGLKMVLERFGNAAHHQGERDQHSNVERQCLQQQCDERSGFGRPDQSGGIDPPAIVHSRREQHCNLRLGTSLTLQPRHHPVTEFLVAQLRRQQCKRTRRYPNIGQSSVGLRQEFGNSSSKFGLCLIAGNYNRGGSDAQRHTL